MTTPEVVQVDLSGPLPIVIRSLNVFSGQPLPLFCVKMFGVAGPRCPSPATAAIFFMFAAVFS